MLKHKIIAAAAIAAIFTLNFPTDTFGFGAKPKKQVAFKVRIENISDKDGITADDGSKYPFAVSPGSYAATNGKLDYFRTGKKATKGLEAQAEDGDPSLLIKEVQSQGVPGYYGIFDQPIGAETASPILHDGAFEFTFNATRGMSLNVIAMFGQSNDLFYAPSQAIDLFDAAGNPITGDVTSKFELWDAGTEVNQAPGVGADQGPRQSMKNVGAAENSVVRIVRDGFKYPDTKDVLRITITVQ